MSVAVVHVYLTSILKIDATDYGSDGDLVKEGFMSGLATFLVRSLVEQPTQLNSPELFPPTPLFYGLQFLWISVYSFLL